MNINLKVEESEICLNIFIDQIHFIIEKIAELEINYIQIESCLQLCEFF